MMKKFLMMITTASVACALAAGCSQEKQSDEGDFKYLMEEFADLKVMKYRVPDWDGLSLQQKAYLYHLTESAKWGRDIVWAQFGKHGLEIRSLLETIIKEYGGDKECQEYQDFLVYAKRVFFSNGIYHHYAEDKIVPACSEEYFAHLAEQVALSEEFESLRRVIFDPAFEAQRKCTDNSMDIVKNSFGTFYEGVTQKEAEKFYASVIDVNDPTPVSYGLNSRLVKENGRLVEKPYKIGGLYSAAIEKVVEELLKAYDCAENDVQKEYISDLVDYYRTGDLKTWDEYNVKWVKDTESRCDFVNGFIEDYNDPLGRKATWEAVVNYKDLKESERTEVLCANAQWFEDNSPVAPQFKKAKVKGVSAKVINVTAFGGESYPTPPIGINLPNADWIRKDYGSKSVTIANVSHAYDMAALESPKSTMAEFAFSQEEIDRAKKYLAQTNDVHTDLHECLGHGSGQLLPGTPANAMAQYSSTLEEARADLFALYYMADPKVVELGILPDAEAYKAQYENYIRNGIMVQFTRVELGRQNTEAHMQNRKLIAEWCYEKGKAQNIIEKKVRDGKTYFVVNDCKALQGLFGELLAEVQRIKSEGDFEAGKALVENYAVNIDYDLHKEVLERYSSLGLKPYGGFVNPEIVPVEKGGKVVDYKIEYPESFLAQNLHYSEKYSTL